MGYNRFNYVYFSSEIPNIKNIEICDWYIKHFFKVRCISKKKKKKILHAQTTEVLFSFQIDGTRMVC